MLELIHIQKRYQYEKILNDIHITLPENGLISIVGPSGCGKSTLLHIIGGIDKCFQGDMKWQGKSVKKRLGHYRQRHVSYIFQQFHLVMWLSIQQNVSLSNYFHSQCPPKQNLDIQEFNQLNISSLSLGQRQRIAYLRAYYQQSDILLCDEPTGSLDHNNADIVMQLLQEESKHRLVVVVSHDLNMVEKYSDEIYEMSDGQIINHRIIQNIHYQQPSMSKKKHILFPQVRLSFMSLLSHKARSFQLVFGLMLSLVCIVLTLTMSRGMENQIRQYIYSLIPESSISFQNQNHTTISFSVVKQLQTETSLSRIQLYLDDYEFLGIGFKEERYQESETLFIGDDTSPYEDLTLKYGSYPKTNQDILVSLSTAKRLCSQEDISTLVGKKIFAWYKHQNDVKAITYHVVGITNNSTTMETLYQKPNAYIDLLKDVYQYNIETVRASMGIIYVHKDKQRSEVCLQLQKEYPQYKFIEVGASTLKNISSTMSQVKMVLIIFSVLAVLSSLFLIGEVMFLNVVQKKKDLSIMKCFGATTFDLLKIVLYESLEVAFLAQVLATIFYIQLLNLANNIVRDMFLNETMIFSIDYQLLAIVYLGSLILVFCSQLIPLIYVLKLNTIEALKQ